MDSQIVIVILRLLHVTAGMFWVGSALTTSFLVLPTVRATGPAGGQFFGEFMRRSRYHYLMLVSGLVTIASGLALYWDFYAGLAWSLSNPGPETIFGLGGLIAIVVAVTANLLIPQRLPAACRDRQPHPGRRHQRRRAGARTRRRARPAIAAPRPYRHGQCIAAASGGRPDGRRPLHLRRAPVFRATLCLSAHNRPSAARRKAGHEDRRFRNRHGRQGNCRQAGGPRPRCGHGHPQPRGDACPRP